MCIERPSYSVVPGALQKHSESTCLSRCVWLPIQWEGEKPVIRRQKVAIPVSLPNASGCEKDVPAKGAAAGQKTRAGVFKAEDSDPRIMGKEAFKNASIAIQMYQCQDGFPCFLCLVNLKCLILRI